MLSFKQYLVESEDGTISQPDDFSEEEFTHLKYHKAFPGVDGIHPIYSDGKLDEGVKEVKGTKRSIVTADTISDDSHPTQSSKRVIGLNVPTHMVTGALNLHAGKVAVYGSDVTPLSTGEAFHIHKKILTDHFSLPLDEQLRRESAAQSRLNKAGYKVGTNPSPKTDTVNVDKGPDGNINAIGSAIKAVSGHSFVISGEKGKPKFHVVNTCPGQTIGCGGGVENGVADTSKGSCFAPHSEAQYKTAAKGRWGFTDAWHSKTKDGENQPVNTEHGHGMTGDAVLSLAASIRNEVRKANKKSKKTGLNHVACVRPNTVSENDLGQTAMIVSALNKQHGKQVAVINQYSKMGAAGSTYSGTGPFTKGGRTIQENIKGNRVRKNRTLNVSDDSSGEDSDAGMNTYTLHDQRRYGDMDKAFQQHAKTARYWDIGKKLSDEETTELSKTATKTPEGHFGNFYDGDGKQVSDIKNAHYGHVIVNHNGANYRFDFQHQHILHPRVVKVERNQWAKDENGNFKKNEKGKRVKEIVSEDNYSDARYLDNAYRDAAIPREQQYKTPNVTSSGKHVRAGSIVITSPTLSTSNLEMGGEMTHPLTHKHIEDMSTNGGFYDMNSPKDQLSAIDGGSQPFVRSNPVEFVKNKKK